MRSTTPFGASTECCLSATTGFSSEFYFRGNCDGQVCSLLSRISFVFVFNHFVSLNVCLRRPDVNFYPLRPEFVESTYLLYLATKNPFYLHVGREIMDSLNTRTRVRCDDTTWAGVIIRN